MHSILTVTAAASTYDITTLANVKAELSVTDAASDVILKRYISGASQAAMQFCNRVFAVEAVSEQFLPGHSTRLFRGGVAPLQLTRWPVVAVSSVTENAVLLVAGMDYLLDAANGQLTRLDSSLFPIAWSPLPLTVAYSAGYAAVPADLEDAVIRMVTRRFSAKGRDPNLKQQNIPGVIEQSWWIATGTESGNMSPDVTDILDNYRVPVSV